MSAEQGPQYQNLSDDRVWIQLQEGELYPEQAIQLFLGGLFCFVCDWKENSHQNFWQDFCLLQDSKLRNPIRLRFHVSQNAGNSKGDPDPLHLEASEFRE